jgi:hypothetical protein
MYTIIAILLAFLAGVILAGGVTYLAVRPAPSVAGPVCAQAANAAQPVNEYATPAPTTGGLNPNDLKTVTHPNLPVRSPSHSKEH